MDPSVFDIIKIGPHGVPALWSYMLPKDLMDFEYPEEKKSSCMSCPKIVTDGFRKDYRCCTYIPKVPNFFIGLALKKGGEGAKRVRAMMKEGYMLPEGLAWTPQKYALYMADLGNDTFGKSKDILCPFLQKSTGYCQMYSFRNSVCSTFFCHNDYGSNGENFWMSIQTIVAQCELALGQWVLDELGLDAEEYFKRVDKLAGKVKSVANPKSLTWNEATQKQLWQQWYGKEEEFFLKAADLVIENKEKLWDIANLTEIFEPLKFDKATKKVVPKEYHDQLDDNDEDEDDEMETVPPRKLWKDVKKAYGKMRNLPGGRLSLNSKMEIIENQKKDSEEKMYSELPVELVFYEKKDKEELESKLFCTEKEGKAFALFSSPRELDFSLLSELEKIMGEDPMPHISQWYGKKILRIDK